MSPAEHYPSGGSFHPPLKTEEEYIQEFLEAEEAEARGGTPYVGMPPYRVLKGLADGTITSYRVTRVETVADAIAREEREAKEVKDATEKQGEKE